VLLLIVGLRRLSINPKSLRKIKTCQTFISSPTIGEDISEDENGDASSLPILSSGSQVLASDTGIDSSDSDNFYQSHAESTITVRETAKLGLEFGILWVESSPSLQRL
jgi:hypothetical protein